MKFFIDTANLDEIRTAHSWGIIAGVTTNPSLIAREGRDFVSTIHEICELVQGPVSAEVVAEDTDTMVEQGLLLAQVHEHVVVKVPLTPEGIAATARLSAKGVKTNVTLCFSANQALLAARAGATYISPFVGRLDDIGHDGIELIEDIVNLYRDHPEIETKVLSASIRHPLHVHRSAQAGADLATVPFKVLRACFNHPLTDKGNAAFTRDWEKTGDTDIAAQVKRFLDR